MNKEMDLVTIIVPLGKGKEVLDLAKQKGIASGFIGVGHGTANKELMEKYGITELQRDVVSIVAPMDMAEIILKLISEKFGLGQPNHGIAYATNVSDVSTEQFKSEESKEAEEDTIKVITAIVPAGKAPYIMDAARSAGAKGGTVIEETSKIEGAELIKQEDDKSDDVVIIIAKQSNVSSIIKAINDSLKEETKTVYAQNAHFVYGLK